MEFSFMSTNIDDALLDVRKAYRLLADYQQRILELLAFIREDLGATYYYQKFRKKPTRGLDRLERSDDGGERLLPFNDVSLLWVRNDGQEDPIHFHRKGDILIDVWVRSDTGNGEDNEERHLPELSRSELRIYFFQCVEPKEDSHNWYGQVWEKTDYPPLGKVTLCDNNPGYQAYGEAINLADLTDEKSVREATTGLRRRASEKLGQII
jgi:hypothetical protein